MKTITKLLSTAVLAAGLLSAPLAHSGFIIGAIVAKGELDSVTQKKKIKELVATIGEEHTDKDQSDYMEVLNPFLHDPRVKVILEGTPASAERSTKEESQSVVDRLYYYAKAPEEIAAKIVLSDWRTGRIGKIIDFFLYPMANLIDKLQEDCIKSVEILEEVSGKDYTQIVEELESLEPWMLANDIYQKNFDYFPNEVVKELENNHNTFIDEAMKKIPAYDCTIKEFEQEITKICGAAGKEKDLKNTPKTIQLSDELIEKLQSSLSEIKRLCGQDENKTILSNFLTHALRQEQFKPLALQTLIKTPWFETLVDALGDYGLIIGAKKSVSHYPITIVIAGAHHIQVLLKQFKEKENFTESFSLKVKDNEEEISPEGFKALFSKLQELSPKETKVKAKRKLVFDDQSNDDDEMPHKKKLKVLKDE